MQVFVRENNVDQALRVLKKKMQREGVFREMKRRKAYEKPSERKTREKAEAIRRARKAARKQAQRDVSATASTEIVHHVPAERPFDLALEQGLLDRRSTSQLMVISDAEYESGMRRLLSDRPTLRADLRLFATVGELEGLNGERLARS